MRKHRTLWKASAGGALMLALSLEMAGAFAASPGIRLPPETADFRSGRNVEIVRESCLECHSADYVTTQVPQTRASWKATLDKMRDKFGMAPLSPNDEANVLDYLVTHYGM